MRDDVTRAIKAIKRAKGLRLSARLDYLVKYCPTATVITGSNRNDVKKREKKKKERKKETPWDKGEKRSEGRKREGGERSEVERERRRNVLEIICGVYVHTKSQCVGKHASVT